MAQQQSDPAAALAFQSDIARALARRPSDMPLHAQVKSQEKRDDDASPVAGRTEEQKQ